MKFSTGLLSLLLVACSAQQKIKVTQTVAPTPPSSISVQGKLYTTLYQQKAAEYRALCYQAYNIARLRVDQWKQINSTLPTAIITDIDETILDNSPNAAHQALLNKDYEQSAWEEWTAKAQADTVPGALSFLKYAASNGIEVFYITNRLEKERAGTLSNLQKFNFPNADNAHLILKQTTSSKEARRQAVMKTHSVLLLMGDNLADFSALYDKKTVDERLQATQQLAAEFGNHFIVLPNPNYGDWESALYNYNYSLIPTQKDSVIKASVKSY